jgi:formate dehydrogenase iron-sulfur subunit
MSTEPMGFFTDTTVCIGCRACEVACKQWNRLPAATNGGTEMSGRSYENTLHLDNLHWRHVRFHEDFEDGAATPRWLLMSDSCKHCRDAACLAACPEQAIIRTEFDSVFIRPDKCKGHWACAEPGNVRCATTEYATTCRRRARRLVPRTPSSSELLRA